MINLWHRDRTPQPLARGLYTPTLCVLAIFCVLAIAKSAAEEKTYPIKPIKLVVGFSAGGNSDATARLLASALSASLRQPVIVENRTGAGGIVAANFVAKEFPDGYTLLLSSVGPLCVAPQFVKNLPYNPQTDFAPISMLTSSDLIMVVNPAVGVRTLAEFTTMAKANPRTLTIASTGVGSAGHLAIELYERAAGVDVIHVPYRNVGSLSSDLLGGRVSATFAPAMRIHQHLADGTLIALAGTGPKRVAATPNIPTFTELGYQGFEVLDWYALLAPANTPSAILDRLNNEVVKGLSDPSTATQLAAFGLEPTPSSRAALAVYIQKEARNWSLIMGSATERPP